ncbi:hypothetical protein [Marinobacter adhaerens]
MRAHPTGTDDVLVIEAGTLLDEKAVETCSKRARCGRSLGALSDHL